MIKFDNFELRCKKCGSINVDLSIQMFDSCDIRDISCNDCGISESW